MKKLSAPIIKVFLNCFIFLSLLLLNQTPCVAQEPLNVIKDKIGITEHLGAQLPLDTLWKNENGDAVSLGSYFQSNKPVFIQFVYFNCPQLCNLVIESFVDSVRPLQNDLAEEAIILSISFDPTDTQERARSYKNKHIHTLPDDLQKQWHFLTGTLDNIKKITKTVGFGYKYNEKTKEYAHSAATYVVTPTGKISRYLYGITYDKKTLNLAISESKEEQFRSTVERVLLFCYNYDPQSRGYVLQAVKLMKIGGILTILCFGYFIYKLVKNKPRTPNG